MLGVHTHRWTEAYSYDTTGKLTHATASAHQAAGEHDFDGTRIRRACRTTYEHDAQGRLTRKSRKLLNGQTSVWTYTWNAEDRLVMAGTPDGENWHYTCDPLGRRIAKYTTADDGTCSTTTFSWEDTRLAEQTAPDGRGPTGDYAPGAHRPLARKAGGSLLSELAADPTADRTINFHAAITDPVGTPTELISADGELSWHHRPALWGTPHPTGLDGIAVDCPRRLPGQYADPETGLHYNHFRYYDPETAHYLGPDPLGLGAGPNEYWYGPNPLTWIDPFSLALCRTSQGWRTAIPRRSDGTSTSGTSRVPAPSGTETSCRPQPPAHKRKRPPRA